MAPFVRHVSVCPLGHSATPLCFAILENLKSVKQVQISFHTPARPHFSVTAAESAHVHRALKQKLSRDSSADVAHRRDLCGSL